MRDEDMRDLPKITLRRSKARATGAGAQGRLPYAERGATARSTTRFHSRTRFHNEASCTHVAATPAWQRATAQVHVRFKARSSLVMPAPCRDEAWRSRPRGRPETRAVPSRHLAVWML